MDVRKRIFDCLADAGSAYILCKSYKKINVNKYKYSITITYFQMAQLVLLGKKARKPENRDEKLIVDVCHEIANLNSSCIDEIKIDEERAVALKYLIEILI